MADFDFVVGSPEEWKAFAQRNPRFVGRRHRIEQACSVILDRAIKESTLMDKVVFFAGHRIVDDFMEVVTLAGNGEGRGAQKLLRPMLEQLVTVKYLIKHPEQVDRYWQYFRVDRHRLAKAIDSTLGPEVLGPPTMARVTADFDEVKSLFMVTDCKKCDTKRLAFAWTQVDLVTMAREVGAEVFLTAAYYLPLEQSHPKVGGMLSRLVEKSDGSIGPAPRLDRGTADEALRVAHGMLILALAAQVDYFSLDNGPLVTELDSDFGEIWKGSLKSDAQTGGES